MTAQRVAAHRLTFDRVPAPYGEPAADDELARDVAAGVAVEPGPMRDYLRARTRFFDHVVTSAAGCGSAMKEYGELVGTPEAQRFAERVVDVTELLGSVEPRAARGPVPLKVVYHDACHLAHAQKVREQPRAMLRTIPELELLENPVEPDICCGSAGVYNMLQPEAGADLGVRKARNLLDTGAEALAAANPGCAAQLDRHFRDLGKPLPIYHPVELVWRSIRAAAA